MKRTATEVCAVLNEQKGVAPSDRIPFIPSRHLTALMEVGSGAHGTKLDPSDPHFIDDTDYLAVILPPKPSVLGLKEWTHLNWTQDDMDIQTMSWDKYIRLLLKSNPNVLGCLWSQHSYLYDSYPFRYLTTRRSIFASKQVHASFIGYANGQLHKMRHQAYAGYMGEKRKQLVDAYGYDCKNAAHAVRLLRMGIEFLKTGEFSVDRSNIDASELRAIKSGKLKMYEIEKMTGELMDEARSALAASTLPDEPDYRAAEMVLLEGYKHDWS